MNARIRSSKGSTLKWSLSTLAVGATAVLVGLAGPVETAEAALRTTRVNGTTVTITGMDMHNWSRLSPTNGDTTMLQDGSRGEVWTFEATPGQCFDITMRSDDFHPYISLRQGAPFGTEIAHDDSRTDNWAKIHGTAGRDGPYYVVATSSGRGEKHGDYTLDIKSCEAADAPASSGGSNGNGGGGGSTRGML